MKLDLDYLSDNFQSQGLKGLRDEINELDLGDGFSFVSTGIASALISTIDFIEQLIGLKDETRDADEKHEEKAFVTSEISRNLLLARLMLMESGDEDLNSQFRKALQKIDVVFNGADLDMAPDPAQSTSFIRNNKLDHYIQGGILLGFRPNGKGAYSSDDAEVLQLHTLDEFDMRGMLDVVNETLLSFESIYDYERNDQIRFQVNVEPSYDDMFEKLSISNLELPHLTDRVQMNLLANSLETVINDYASRNVMFRERIQSFIEEHELANDYFVMIYQHHKEKASSSSDEASTISN